MSEERMMMRRDETGPPVRKMVFYVLVWTLIAGMAAGIYVTLRMAREHMGKQEACATAQATIIQESDALLAHDRFPSREQQDQWRQLLQACAP